MPQPTIRYTCEQLQSIQAQVSKLKLKVQELITECAGVAKLLDKLDATSQSLLQERDTKDLKLTQSTLSLSHSTQTQLASSTQSQTALQSPPSLLSVALQDADPSGRAECRELILNF